MDRKRILISILLCLSLIFTLTACGPQESSDVNGDEAGDDFDYPTSPINLIVPFAAGGGTDVMCRAVVAALDLPQPMVITNIEGGGSSVGSMEAYHSDPDGYTVLSVALEALIAGCYSGTYTERDAYENFIHLCSMATDGQILLASKASGFTNLQQIIDHVNAKPGDITICGTGSMSFTNAAAVELVTTLGLDIEYVPYDGAAKSRAAVMGGHEELAVMGISEAYPAIDSGDAVAICVLTAKRSEFYPDVPSVNETEDYGLDIALHRTFFLPPKTPKAIVDYLADAFEKAGKDPELQTILRDLYYAPEFIGPQDIKPYGDGRYKDMEALFEALMAL